MQWYDIAVSELCLLVFNLSLAEDDATGLISVGLRVTSCCEMHCRVNHLTCFVTLDLYDTCLVPSTVRLPLPTALRQCDNLPFIKFTTYCPLNPILDATKINPLKFRACVAIRNTHYDEHFVQFVTAVCGPKSPLTTRRSLWLKDKHCLLIASCFDAFSFSLLSPLYFMIMERSSPRNTVAYCSDRLRKRSIPILS